MILSTFFKYVFSFLSIPLYMIIIAAISQDADSTVKGFLSKDLIVPALKSCFVVAFFLFAINAGLSAFDKLHGKISFVIKDFVSFSYSVSATIILAYAYANENKPLILMYFVLWLFYVVVNLDVEKTDIGKKFDALIKISVKWAGVLSVVVAILFYNYFESVLAYLNKIQF